MRDLPHTIPICETRGWSDIARVTIGDTIISYLSLKSTDGGRKGNECEQQFHRENILSENHLSNKHFYVIYASNFGKGWTIRPIGLVQS